MSEPNLIIALAGNPNSGKTTIFNNLTGARQHVGNYPGVTVERREGFCRYQGRNLTIVDLPGTYSLTAYALDELVARHFIIEEKPDIIVNILDAANLERNLYLAVQLLELERPLVLALNMADMADKAGLKIDDKALGVKLGCPVVRTVGNKQQGMEELLRAAVALGEKKHDGAFMVDYGPEIEQAVAKVVDSLAAVPGLAYPKRWLAVKMLENDRNVIESIGAREGCQSVIAQVEVLRRELTETTQQEPELAIANRRYGYVAAVFNSAVVAGRGEAASTSDKIDAVLTNRVLGLPIFFALMWLLFNVVFELGVYPQEWLEAGIGAFGDWVGQTMPEGDLRSLVVDGIIGGVGGVLSFFPLVLLLFLGIAILEDSGYMARAAFVMDRVMRAVGLHGKSFIPLLIGFGCTVPAVMGTRTLENKNDRMVTLLVVQLMSCGARLPVYTLLIAAFFPAESAGTVLFSIYVLGIALAVIMAYALRKTLFKGEAEPFVMELPPYHTPTLRSILSHMWERGYLYLKKAGTIILAVSIVVWFLTNYPAEVEYSKDFEQLSAQAAEHFEGHVARDILAPLGIASLEDNTELSAMIDDIKAVEEDFAAQAEEAGEDEVLLATLEADKESKLKEFEATGAALYPFAQQYLEFETEKDEELAALEGEQSSEKLAGSYAGQFGHWIEPVIRPLGFDWKIGVGLFAAFTAKEVLVSTLGTIYSLGETDETSVSLKDAIMADPHFSPLIAYSLMAFVLLYAPCLAVLAVVKRETNSWKWAIFSSAYGTALAYIVSLAIYQIGTLLGY
ncbi:ferrous iron transport protein B|uniref:Ferrous iron transport protein B n=1 Tax=Dendrosporobacter quercicolus TaxID=146817 RepID=A0A1G9R0J4_9FIRM|nr:ferrous iron transport protein B [Dendrosporobacter quercicolus]NSL48433.1 ferrous iron transport protein B [Dendrosporobacter quercicolus DSM 1736]SDM16723.1 ferrous iron transport protein B [Dendrosporobacter quercicolus]